MQSSGQGQKTPGQGQKTPGRDRTPGREERKDEELTTGASAPVVSFAPGALLTPGS